MKIPENKQGESFNLNQYLSVNEQYSLALQNRVDENTKYTPPPGDRRSTCTYSFQLSDPFIQAFSWVSWVFSNKRNLHTNN